MEEYKCSLDNVARYIVPGLFLSVTIFILAIVIYLSFDPMEDESILIGYIAPVLGLCAFIWMYLLKPISLIVDDHSITVNRKLNPITIEFSDISSIRKADDMKSAYKYCGNGGLLGYIGKYTTGIGTATWYCTQRKNYILIIKKDEQNIVVTPDDYEGFLKNIASQYPSLFTT